MVNTTNDVTSMLLSASLPNSQLVNPLRAPLLLSADDRPDLSAGNTMARDDRRRYGLTAVLLSLALHALLGGGLLWLSGGRWSAAAPERAAGAAPADDDYDCPLYLVPAPPEAPAPGPRRQVPALPAEEPAPVQRLVALPPEVPRTDVRAQPQPPAPPTPQITPGGGHGLPGKAGGMAATFFGLPAQAKKIVYVLDRSSSMGQNGLLTRAARELLASLERLPPGTQFQVLVYNRTVEALPRGPLAWRDATPEQRQLVAQALLTLPAEGGTDHTPALRGALALRPDVLFLVTDADDLTDAQVQEATRWNAGRTVIHTVELNGANRQRTFMPLQRLARENGGRYQAVDPNAGPLSGTNPNAN
jgi:hypothetical protein